jgi:hypothetical protein
LRSARRGSIEAFMRYAVRVSSRGVLALLCALVLVLQATALPILHAVHWSETAQAGTAVESSATCCPHGHGPAIESAGSHLPVHDSGACPTCAIVAQHRGAALAAPAIRPAPSLEALRFVAGASRPFAGTARVVAGPRAPPLLCA